MSSDSRKADTRRKIELGGLIIKAGLGDADPAVILGALLLTARRLADTDGPATLAKLKEVGDAAFSVLPSNQNKSQRAP